MSAIVRMRKSFFLGFYIIDEKCSGTQERLLSIIFLNWECEEQWTLNSWTYQGKWFSLTNLVLNSTLSEKVWSVIHKLCSFNHGKNLRRFCYQIFQAIEIIISTIFDFELHSYSYLHCYFTKQCFFVTIHNTILRT